MARFYLDRFYETPELYDWARVTEWDEDALVTDPTNSMFQHELMKLPVKGTILVARGESFRADLISYRVYGSTRYWWIILKYNRLLHPQEIVDGMRLNYPDLPALDSIISELAPRSLVRVERDLEEILPTSVDPQLLDLGSYIAGYIIHDVYEEAEPVLPDIFVTVSDPMNLSLENFAEDWSKSVWTSTHGLARTTTISEGFEKVYFLVPKEDYKNISITNVQSDIGGAWEITEVDLETDIGMTAFYLYTSTSVNLGKIDWLINVSSHKENLEEV